MCGHSLQPAPEADHRLSLCPGNHAAVHSFSDFSVHYFIPAIAGHRIINERLPEWKVLLEHTPTAACPEVCGLRGPIQCYLQLQFEMVLCKLTLISVTRDGQSAGSIGAAFSPDAVSLCCAEVEGQQHLMLCHWAGGEIC